MSTFKQPKDGVKYRIRNMDTGLYLTQGPGSTIVMRPEKTMNQEWRFILVRPATAMVKSPGFRIQDPRNLDESFDRILHISAGSVANDEDPDGSENIWMFATDKLSAPPGCRAFLLGDRSPTTKTYQALSTSNSGDLSVQSVLSKEVGTLAASTTPDTLSLQWEIFEVNPAALPDGDGSVFRIRAFLGKPLQIDASGNINLDLTDQRGNHRAWTITDKGNGSCTIQHRGTNKYLTAQRGNDGRWQPAARDDNQVSADDRVWIFERTTTLTYTIFQLRDKELYALALDESKAILKPKKLAHHQVWLVEPVDAAIGATISEGLGSSQTTSTGYPDGLRENGQYTVRTWNSTPPYFIYLYQTVTSWSSTGTPTCIYSFLTTGTSSSASAMRVEPTRNGFAIYAFPLSYHTSQRVYLSADSSGKIIAVAENTNVNATAWRFTPSGNQFIVTAPNGQVLTSGSSLSLGSATPMNDTKLWQFV